MILHWNEYLSDCHGSLSDVLNFVLPRPYAHLYLLKNSKRKLIWQSAIHVDVDLANLNYINVTL